MINTRKGVRVGKGRKFVECECGAYVIPPKPKCHICKSPLRYYEDFDSSKDAIIQMSEYDQKLEDGFNIMQGLL